MTIMKTLINFIFCKLLYRVNYINLDTLQSCKKCLICPNHSNIFDPTFIYPQVDNLFIMAKQELFKNTFIRWLLLKYNIFPTNRNTVDYKSLRHSLEILKNTENSKLLIFPEGRVIKQKQDIGKYYRKGAVYISASCNIPIVPVYITRRPKFFSKVSVIFGNPIYFSKEELNNKNTIIQKSKELINTIYNIDRS